MQRLKKNIGYASKTETSVIIGTLSLPWPYLHESEHINDKLVGTQQFPA